MIRYIVCGVVLCLCVSLQMGWKEVAAIYHLNYHSDEKQATEDFSSFMEGGENGKMSEQLYWTDIYAPYDSSIDSSLLDASTISEIDQVITKESMLIMTTPSWNLIHNETEYTVESRAVKSNSMSIMENPMIRIRMAPIPCHSSQHLLQEVILPQSLMASFFPLFHIYESKAATAIAETGAGTERNASEAVDSPGIREEETDTVLETEAESEAEQSSDRGGKETSTSTTAELRTVIAPLIWPFEERKLTLLNLIDMQTSGDSHHSLYRSRSISGLELGARSATSPNSNTNTDRDSSSSLATTSLSLIVNITSVLRTDEAQSMECMAEVLLHSANVLPHPMLNFFFETDFLSPKIAQFFIKYSEHFFPHLMTGDSK